MNTSVKQLHKTLLQFTQTLDLYDSITQEINTLSQKLKGLELKQKEYNKVRASLSKELRTLARQYCFRDGKYQPAILKDLLIEENLWPMTTNKTGKKRPMGLPAMLDSDDPQIVLFGKAVNSFRALCSQWNKALEKQDSTNTQNTQPKDTQQKSSELQGQTDENESTSNQPKTPSEATAQNEPTHGPSQTEKEPQTANLTDTNEIYQAVTALDSQDQEALFLSCLRNPETRANLMAAFLKFKQEQA